MTEPSGSEVRSQVLARVRGLEVGGCSLRSKEKAERAPWGQRQRARAVGTDLWSQRLGLGNCSGPLSLPRCSGPLSTAPDSVPSTAETLLP